jgi:hypothetical protein
VSRTQAEPARRKDYAARHDGKEILVAISPEAASQRFHDSETARRKQQRQQQEASESEAVKKFRGPPLKKDVMDRLVKRLADESQERQVSSLESLREQYFKKYSADNVPLKSAPRSVIPSVT